jgi:hypothetical protein
MEVVLRNVKRRCPENMFITAISLVRRLMKLVPKRVNIGTKTYILGINIDALL